MEWDKATQEAFDKFDGDKQLFDVLHNSLITGITLRSEAKKLEEDAKEMVRGANDEIMTALFTLGLDSAKAPEYGTVRIKTTTRTSYNTDKIGEYLLKKGVDAKVIQGAIKAGKKESTSEYVEFRRPTKKG
jgi:hypothetical protein